MMERLKTYHRNDRGRGGEYATVIIREIVYPDEYPIEGLRFYFEANADRCWTIHNVSNYEELPKWVTYA